jgi:hypothetical protein
MNSWLVVCLLSVLLLSACGDSPTAPSNTQVPCAIGYHRVDTPTISNCQPN